MGNQFRTTVYVVRRGMVIILVVHLDFIIFSQVGKILGLIQEL